MNGSVEGGLGSLTGEGKGSGGHLVKHNAEGKNVGAAVDFLPQPLLGRHIADQVQGGLHLLARRVVNARRRPFGSQLPQPKIENLYVTRGGQEDFRWSNVTVDDSMGVSSVQGVSGLRSYPQHFCGAKPTPGEALLESLALEKLHGNEIPALRLANLVGGTNVGMAQSGNSTSVLHELPESLLVTDKLGRQEFQCRHGAALGVFRLEDFTHPTAAELFQDTVVGNCLANHGKGAPPAVVILGPAREVSQRDR